MLSSDSYNEDFKVGKKAWDALKDGRVEDLRYKRGAMSCHTGGEIVRWKPEIFNPEMVDWESGELDLRSTYFPPDSYARLKTKLTSTKAKKVQFGYSVFEDADFEETLLPASDFRVSIFENANFKASIFDGALHMNCTFFRGFTIFNRSTFHDDVLFTSASFNKISFKEAVFNERAFFENTMFTEDAVFDNAIFSNRAIFTDKVKFKGKADFIVAEFRSTAEFNGAEFNGDAVFDNAIFSNRAIFTDKVKFKGKAEFSVAEFRSTAEFNGAEFNGDAVFNSAIFFGRAIFTDKVKFKGKADFSVAEFRSTAEFNGAEFIVDAVFNGVIFFGRTIFTDKVKFKGKADFSVAEFRSAAEFNGAEFIGDAVFDNAIFSKWAIFTDKVKFKGKADFSVAEFGSTADFSGAVFADDVDFSGAEFSGATFFINDVHFEGKVDFSVAEFGPYVRFSGAVFEEDVTFERATFGGKTIIGSKEKYYAYDIVQFKKLADFKGATITNALFNGALFEQISFEETVFTKEAHFENTLFNGNIKFIKTKFERHFYFKAHNNGYENVRFEEVWFGGRTEIFGKIKFLSLRGSVIEGTLDLNRLPLSAKSDTVRRSETLNPSEKMDKEEHGCMALDIYKVNVMGMILVDWKERNVEEAVYEGNIAYHSLSESEKNDDLTEDPRNKRFPIKGYYSHKEIAYQFQVLKETYDKLGLYEYEDEAMVKCMRARNRQRREELLISDSLKNKEYYRKIRRLFNFFGNLFGWVGIALADAVGKLGTSPLRVAIWIGMLPFIFGFFFTVFPAFAGLPFSGELNWSVFVEESRTSWVSFLTMSLGVDADIIPSGQQIWLIAEGVLGLFLMAYFTISVARRTMK